MGARDDIARRRADFVTAFNREDLASIEQVCADDIIMLPSNQPPIVGIRNAVQWWSIGFEAGRTTVTIAPRELYLTEGWAMDWFDLVGDARSGHGHRACRGFWKFVLGVAVPRS